MNPRPLGYESGGRSPSPSRPVSHVHAGLSRRRHAVLACPTRSCPFRKVLVTVMVTKGQPHGQRHSRNPGLAASGCGVRAIVRRQTVLTVGRQMTCGERAVENSLGTAGSGAALPLPGSTDLHRPMAWSYGGSALSPGLAALSLAASGSHIRLRVGCRSWLARFGGRWCRCLGLDYLGSDLFGAVPGCGAAGLRRGMPGPWRSRRRWGSPGCCGNCAPRPG